MGRAAAKGLQSKVDAPDDLPAFVIGDSVRLRAALENSDRQCSEVHRAG